MNRIENYLLTALDTTAGLQKAILKASRFGLKGHNPDKPKLLNERKMVEEYYELCAVMEYLMDNSYLPCFSDDVINSIMHDKVTQLVDYVNLSAELGIVKGDTQC